MNVQGGKDENAKKAADAPTSAATATTTKTATAPATATIPPKPTTTTTTTTTAPTSTTTATKAAPTTTTTTAPTTTTATKAAPTTTTTTAPRAASTEAEAKASTTMPSAQPLAPTEATPSDTTMRTADAVTVVPKADWHDMETAHMGATAIDERTCAFRLWAPHAAEMWIVVSKVGEATHFCRYPMEDIGDSIWAIQLTGFHTRLMTYHIDIKPNWNDCYHSEGEIISRRDPWAKRTVFESNECYIVPSLNKASEKFDMPPWNELIMYELHIGTYPAPGDGRPLARTAAQLERIRQMGFNALEIMPLQEFGGKWGYNPRLLQAVHGPFGTPEDLTALVHEAHTQGMACILDIVLNHGSAHANSLWNWDGYGPNGNGGIFFEGESDTGWGRKLAFQVPMVRDLIVSAARTFLEDYNMDGLRFDSVHNMPWQFLKDVVGELKRRHPGKILIAEITPENPAICRDVKFDGCWVHSTYYDMVEICLGLREGRTGSPPKATAASP
eukprot:Polyplicarium_translucidae@DN3193_c0_g1_i3.p1